ncbi:uncharacterized protein SPPG_06868 [Spizellomyces punctatus DAOM BR117]|uniref:C2 domain-containing protein n=1 Tax=Spizellomyces punctatus (strain DAOM BR117) TaxID=645134 RepID=A0A0L0H8L3_SPIPD|nr:uncharacterized protein SPPG_06868 [Spizellomyces punctatus DAOM BR117]KNC97875.1 hypothetical protein SPPG_06868 [Spizellomyces punctatus DAOM BR117]|eukprot:XP_016605915.1 hypothetical protein SPPG_06868 [Spizellomyces punctatus DAOM BR117]
MPILAAATSNLPPPPPPLSLPPKVVGPVRYFLSVTVSKLVWTNPPSPERSSTASLPRVRLHWWGEDGPGTIFSPQSVGGRTRMSPSKPSSSIPVPPIRAKTWSSPVTTTSSPGRNTVHYPVRCSKRQLRAYFRDMGSLLLLVIVHDRVAAEVKVHDLSILVDEPSRPINGFFPVVEKSPSNSDFFTDKGQPRKLGELHLAMMLETALPNYDGSGQVKLNRHYTQAPHGIFDLGNEQDDSSLLQHQPREPPGPPTDRNHPENTFLSRSTETTGSSVLPEPPLLLKHLDEAEAEVIDDSHRASVNIETLRVVSPRDDSGEVKGMDAKREIRPPGQSEGRSLTSSRSIPIHEKEVIEPQTSTGGNPETPLNMVDPTNIPKSPNANEADVLRALGDELDDADNLDTISAEVAGLLADDDGLLSHSIGIEESESDLFDDDLIIEALNSASGKSFIERRARESSSEHVHDGNLDTRTRTEERFSSDSEDEVSDMSDDERKRRALFDRNWKNQSRKSAVPMGGGNHVQNDLSVNKLTSLGRVDYVEITIRGLELVPDVLPHASATYFVEYRLPGTGTDTTVKASSKTVPRLTVSRNASRRSLVESDDPPMYVLEFDHQERFPYTFNSTTVELWNMQDIEVQVVAERKSFFAPASRNGTVPHQKLWTAAGILKCDDVLNATNFTWSGRIPVWSSETGGVGGKRKPMIPNIGKRRSSQRDHRHLIGYLIMKVQLASDRVTLSKPDARPTYTSAFHGRNPEKPDDEMEPVQDSEPRLIHDGESQLPPVTPYYLHLHISTARSLSILPTFEGNSTLLYLVIRLFSATTPPIETPPISYSPPFDLTNGRLNSPPNFAFSYTLPLAVTQEFIDSHRETPLIVEVWVIDGDSLKSSSMLNARNALADHTDRGAKLLGLMRLPFHHLLGTMAATLQQNQGASFSGQDMPVMIPEAEYVVTDPFSGTAKGWIRSFLALGNWDQIRRVRKVSRASEIADDEDLSEVQMARKRQAGRGQDSRRSRRRDAARVRPRHVTVETDSPDSPTITAEDVSRNDIPTECQIEISIHRACGLRALVRRLIAAQSSKYIQEYTPLDFAKEIGPNSYVRFHPFPESVQVITNQNSNEDEGFDGDAIIISPIVAQTFTPEYEHTATLTIRGVDTNLLRWIRKGGEARGEIWHHVPGEVTDQEDGEDFLLGTFSLPLGALLSRPNGIDGTWVPVRFERSDPGKVEAAIKLSMRFRTGFEFGHVVEGVDATRGLGWWSRLKVGVSKLQLHLNHLDVVKHYLQQKGNLTETQAGRQLYVRWKYPVPTEDEQGLRIEEEESPAVPSKSPVHPDRLTTVEMSYSKSVDIEMTQAVIRWFRERELNMEVRQRGEEGEGDTLIGTAYIDLHDLVSKARHSQRRRGRQMTRTKSEAEWLVEGSFPLINPKSPDLMGASVTVRISMSPVSPSKVRDPPPISRSSAQLPSSQGIGRSPPGRMTDLGARGQLSPGGAQHQSPGIPVEITVERALHLPLMADPFAEYLASPFVSQNEKQTVLPNAYVTFDWSGSDKQEDLSGQTLRTHVATAQRSPTWNVTVSVSQERSEKALKMLKYEKAIIFKVWHAPNVNVSRQHAGRDKPEINDETRSELLGTARVDLGSLFGGLKEINGWYHILDGRGVSKGQLLIKVHPLENVGAVLRELTGYQEKRHSSRSIKATGRRPLEAACGKAVDDVTPAGIATSVRQIPTGESIGAYAGLCSSSLDSTAVTNPQSVDTWVWTGHKWEHRQVEVRAVDVAEGAQGNDRAKMSPSKSRNASEERSEGNLRSSLQKTMEELEELNQKLKEKTGGTDLTEMIQQNDVEREVADFEPDRSLPADEGSTASPSWKAHPRFERNETPTHPASAKSGYQSGNSSTACRGPDPSKAQALATDVPFSDTASFRLEEKEEFRLTYLTTPSKEVSRPIEVIAQSHIHSPEKAQLVQEETSSRRDITNQQPVMLEEADIAQEKSVHEQDESEPNKSVHVSQQTVEGNQANDACSGSVEASAVGDTTKVLPSDGGTTIADIGYEQVPDSQVTTLAWTTLAKRLDAVEAAASQDDYEDDFDMLDTAEADVNAEDGKYDETIAVDEQLANSIVTSTVSENDHEDIKVRLPKKDDAADEYQSPSLLPPDLRVHQRASLGRDEEKENIDMVPDEDNNETDDDDIYSILAYRRMAAAAAAVGVSKASSSVSRGRTIVASALEEAAQKPPRLPASARSSKTYDPFGVRNRETRISWKAAVDSDTSMDAEGSATWTRGEHRRVEHEGGETRNWRAVLGGKTGAVDKARIDTMEKIFWAGKERRLSE